jgi:hypothetical protein
MHEALRAIKSLGDKLPWMSHVDEPVQGIAPPTPLDEVKELVLLAGGGGRIERDSATWIAVMRWAATEIIHAQSQLEVAREERSMLLRTRIAVLRELLILR